VCVEFLRVIGIGFAVSMSWRRDPAAPEHDAGPMSNKVIFFSKTWYPAWIIDEVEELTKNPNIGSIDYQRHFRAARAALYLVAVLGSKTTSSLLNAEAQARYLERLSTLDAAHN
jgi:hypothetical protein